MQSTGAPIAARKPRTVRTVGAIGLSVVTVMGGAWLLRLPLAQAASEAYLRQNGIEARLRVRALSLSGVTAEAVRLGPAASPDLSIDRLRVTFVWRGLLPSLKRVDAIKPSLVGAWKDDHFSFGSLDRLTAPPDGKAKPLMLPALAVNVQNGQIRLETPVGVMSGSVNSKGVLGQTFLADGQWQLRANAEAGSIAGPFTLRADSSGLAASVRGTASNLALSGLSGSAVRLRADLASDLAMQAVTGSAELFADDLQAPFGTWNQPALRLEGGRNSGDSGGVRWRARAALRGADWQAAGLSGADLMAKLALDGTATSGGGRLDASAQTLSGPGFTATKLSLSGPLAAQSLMPLSGKFEASLEASLIAATAGLRASVTSALAALKGGPVDDFAARAAQGLDTAMAKANLRAEGLLTLDQQGSALAFRQPAELRAANGAALRLQLSPEGVRVSNTGAVRAAGALLFSGPGLPDLQLDLQEVTRSASGDTRLQGTLQGKWLAGQSRLAMENAGFFAELSADGTGRASTSGQVDADLLSPDLRLQGVRLPLGGALNWGGGGLSVGLPAPGCATVRVKRLDAGGLRLEQPAFALCAPNGKVFSSQNGRASGGFRLSPITWRGSLDGQPLSLDTSAITGQWGRSAAAPNLRLALTRVQLRQPNGLQAGLGRNRVDLLFGAPFSASGHLEGGTFAQKDLPTQLSALAFDWALSPAGEFALRGGSGHLRAAGAEIAVHQPIRLTKLELTQTGSHLRGSGRAELETPKAELGQFTLGHDRSTGAGEAEWQTSALTFSQALQPYQISETLRGVIELTRGAVAGSVLAKWDAKGLAKVSALVDLQKLSFSTLALGPIDGVSGQIAFDDLLAATTLEGQTVTVAKINPGLPVENGSFTFQLQPKGMLRLQSATWPYAKGVLSIDPTYVQLGGDITKFNLRLSGVDLPALLDQLSLSNSVRATGTVEGEFPLVFSPAGGRIENGRLAAIGAGLIAMQSPALDQTVAQGAAAGQAGGVGFLQALQGFSYNELALKNVNGAIDGEIVADIVFAGENVAPISLPVPGGKNLVGLPYRFKVSVRAPLLQLSRSAETALDYKSSIEQALELEKSNPPAPLPAPAPAKTPTAPR